MHTLSTYRAQGNGATPSTTGTTHVETKTFRAVSNDTDEWQKLAHFVQKEKPSLAINRDHIKLLKWHASKYHFPETPVV